MNYKEDILNFILDLKSKYGHLPKFDHSKTPNKVYYNTPYFDDAELISAIETLLFGKWSANGEKIAKFEIEYAKTVKNTSALMVSSGSTADYLMVRSFKERFDIPDGAEIICSVVGFPTTYSAIILNNLIPRFVDIELETLNFDLNQIEAYINKKTVAILNSPVLGNTANIDDLTSLCNKYDIKFLQDHCDSLGTTWNGKELTEYSYAAAVSLYMAHHITDGGHGGAISSNDEELINIARSLSRWGSSCYCKATVNLNPNGACGKRFSNWLVNRPETICDHKYVYDRIGGNYQPGMDLQGAIALEQIKKLPEIHTKRKLHKNLIFDIYKSYIPQLETAKNHKQCDPSWFGLSLICPDKFFKTKLVSFLEKNGIQTREMFAGNILAHNGFAKYGDWSKYPNANEIYDRVFFVGCSPSYKEMHFDYLKEVLSKYE